MANPERSLPGDTTPPNEPLPAYSPHTELPPPSPAQLSYHEQSILEQQQDEGPPPYTEVSGGVDIHQGGLDTAAHVAEDGRVNININEKTRRMSQMLERQWITASQEPLVVPPGMKHVPPLNILIQIIGSRGDVQPFIALGQELRRRYTHRVRVATHPVFKEFVEESGLEFFSLGGDPAELMAFMVKNPGLVPGLESLRAGDVTKRRKGMWEVLLGGWRACIEPNADGGVPFVADAIIANPPSFAHIHCAEKLGVPLHLMFTMPWSPTAAFPHPLANIESTNAEASVTNFLSYALVELLTWQGLGDLVNKFREKTLGLEPISSIWAPGMISRLKVPHTYCWSPSLIPKPSDWGSYVSISGFFFLPLAHTYTPTEELAYFLAAGPPPVYIGFGSIVVDNPDGFTAKIVEAVKLANCRALISQGWGGLGNSSLSLPENVMLLGNCPHDWLFPQCAAVIHHGGAGTTAAGIRCGKPTVVVPFFGDQQFWGNMVARAGAGPDPIHHSQLTAENLAERIRNALAPGANRRAEELGARIRTENGAEEGAKSFHQHLHVGTCDLLRDRVAVWKVKGSNTKLSALAARVLVENQKINNGYAGLRLWRHREWPTDEGPVEPISGASGALLGTIGTMMMGVGDFPRDIHKIFRTSTAKGKEVTPNGSQSSSSGIKPSLNSSSSKASINSDKISLNSGMSSLEQPTSPTAPPETPTSPEPLSTSQKIESVINASKGVKKIVGAGLKSPMDFTLGLAQGFRNAPRLYGDSVRPAPRVTDLQSGLRAAGKELTLGIFDGVTGLVTQPFEGAKQEGAAGLVKGTGKGLAGLVLKSGAAIYGLPGYAMKGVYAEILKRGRKDVTDWVSMARVAQGMAEGCEEETERLVLERWGDRALMIKKRFTFPRTKSGKKVAQGTEYDEDPGYVDVDKEMEESIKRSVQQTSRGVTEEDEVVEQAIRESLMDPKVAEALKLSIEEEARRKRREEEGQEDDPDVEEALRRSLSLVPVEIDSADEEDAHVQLAMKLSLAEHMRQNQEEEMSQEEKELLNQILRESLRDRRGGGGVVDSREV